MIHTPRSTVPHLPTYLPFLPACLLSPSVVGLCQRSRRNFTRLNIDGIRLPVVSARLSPSGGRALPTFPPEFHPAKRRRHSTPGGVGLRFVRSVRASRWCRRACLPALTIGCRAVPTFAPELHPAKHRRHSTPGGVGQALTLGWSGSANVPSGISPGETSTAFDSRWCRPAVRSVGRSVGRSSA